MKNKTVKIADISIDHDTQQRVEISPQVIAEYAEAMRCGSKFPPITLFSDGVNHYLADGFHRFFAMRACEFADVPAEVHDGTVRDARWYSFAANGQHGLRLTNADKRKSVAAMLSDTEWRTLTDAAIAKQCHVSRRFVGQMRTEIAEDAAKQKVNSSLVIKNSMPGKGFKAPIEAKTDETDEKTITTALPAQEEEDEYAEDKKYSEIDWLKDQVDLLQKQLAVHAMEGTEEEKCLARDIIESQAAEIKSLTETLRAVKISRDTFQTENCQLRKQITMQRKEIDKITGRKTA